MILQEESDELKWLYDTTESISEQERQKAEAFGLLQSLIAYTICIMLVLVETVPRMVLTGIVECIISADERVSNLFADT